MGGKKKYIEIFGSFTEPFNCNLIEKTQWCNWPISGHDWW